MPILQTMNKEQFQDLLERYTKGKASAEEVDLVDAYYKAFDVRPEFTATEAGQPSEKLFLEIKAKIDVQIHRNTQVVKPQLGQHILWRRISAVAAALLLAGTLFYFGAKDSGLQHSQNNEIKPGKMGATLTLANGKQIQISEIPAGKLAEEPGVAISKTKNGQLVYTLNASSTDSGTSSINTLSTSKGQQIQVLLPDGSTVYLNAASSLKYPSSFSKRKERRVELYGEGYFEIAKDRAHPFFVKTNKQQVEVLGTHFNINSYDDAPAIKTTLIEGSVKLSLPGKTKLEDKVLKPGQQSSLIGNHFKIAGVQMDDAIAWKDGYFVFDGEPLTQVMQHISRWYNVDVQFSEASLKNVQLSGSISKYVKITQVLQKLELVGQVQFTINGKKITVERK